MTTLTLEIERDEDLKILQEIIRQMGIKYNIDDNFYSEELKSILDKREDDYLKGNDIPLTPEESERRIDAILNRKK